MEYNLHRNVNLSDVSKIVLSQILIALLLVSISSASTMSSGGTKFTKINRAGLNKLALIKITGKVTDGATGETLIGVSVKVKGSSNGTLTDVKGNFTFTVPDDATLVVSYIGYDTIDVPVDGKTVINIKLSQTSKGLNEVVVVGYGVQKKVTVTGSVASVKGEDLVKSPAVNLSNSIAGRMAGVVATNSSGEPGYDGATINIRGLNTLGSTSPLIVIDGVPAPAGQTNIDRINPADVESMSVLKDASAAIYGARAANGVILITTKHGKLGKPDLSYTYNHGWAQPTLIPKMANSTEYATMVNEIDLYNLDSQYWTAAAAAFKSTGSFTAPDGTVSQATFKPVDFQKFADGSDPWGHPNTDWFKAALKDWSPQTRQNVQLSGGSENIKYLTSIGYLDQDAYYKNSATGYKQYDLRINVDAKVNKYINTTIGVSGRQENRFFPAGESAGDIFRMLTRGYPYRPAYWPNGLPGPDIENGQQPVLITTNATGYDKDTRYYLQTNGKLEIQIPGVPGLKLTGNVALDKYIQQTKNWQTPWYVYSWDYATKDANGIPVLTKVARGPAQAHLEQSSDDELSSMLEGIASYEHSFGGHNVTLLAGVTKEKSNASYFSASRKYFSSTAIDQLSWGGSTEIGADGGGWEKARLNYFGRVGYNYKEKYLAEFLWRVDGSYMFPQTHRFGFFPGISAGWRISEESFFKDNVPFFQNLKLRGSWGQMGNDYVIIPGSNPAVLAEYAYQSLYQVGSYIINGVPTQTLQERTAPNPNFTWEVANNSDVALEGTVLNGKLDFVLEAFLNKRTNVLWYNSNSVPASAIPYSQLPPVNYGKVTNKGWEFQFNYHDNIGKLRYNVGINGGYAKNRIDQWDEAPGAPDYQRSTGHPIGSQLYYVYDGIFATQGEVDAFNTAHPGAYSGVGESAIRVGDMKYKDIGSDNGQKVPDGKIDGYDQVRADKSSTPTFQGGFNFGVQYKGFDLTVLLQAATGGQITLQTESGTIGNFLQWSYDHRWTVENQSTKYPRTVDRNNQYFSGGYYNSAGTLIGGNTYWLLNTNYIRLKNIELGYTIPVSITSKVGINNLRFYVNGLNVLTFANEKIYDPESTSSDGHYYPQARVINLGASVKF